MEKIVKAIFEALLAFFWPKITKPKEAEDGEKVNSREEKLKKKIKKDTMKREKLLVWMLVVSSFGALGGCATRTIYVPDGKAVQLRQQVKNVRVWVWDKEGKRVAGKMTLPEGWYALPLEEEEGNTNEFTQTQ
jgi:hypothetical protein